MIVIALLTMVANAQRPFYAGLRGTGYYNGLVNREQPQLAIPLDSRFNTDDSDTTKEPDATTTIRMPIEANGDTRLIEIIKRLPIDQQPFWFINWMAIEAQKNNGRPLPTPLPTRDNNDIASRFDGGEDNEHFRISYVPIVYPLEWQQFPLV